MVRDAGQGRAEPRRPLHQGARRPQGAVAGPTPFDPADPAFYHPQEVEKALSRVTEICDGCRRCHRLCPSSDYMLGWTPTRATAQPDAYMVAYEKVREDVRARVIELKKARRIALGENLTLLFENRETVLYQTQEMVRTERIVDERKIQDEIDAYRVLLPGPGSSRPRSSSRSRTSRA